MKQQATFRAGFKKIARMTVRVQVSGAPSTGQVTITDLQLQPGGSASGWLPHTMELPWSTGTAAP